MNCGQRLVYMAPGKSAIAGWLAGKKNPHSTCCGDKIKFFTKKFDPYLFLMFA